MQSPKWASALEIPCEALTRKATFQVCFECFCADPKPYYWASSAGHFYFFFFFFFPGCSKCVRILPDSDNFNDCSQFWFYFFHGEAKPQRIRASMWAHVFMATVRRWLASCCSRHKRLELGCQTRWPFCWRAGWKTTDNWCAHLCAIWYWKSTSAGSV